MVDCPQQTLCLPPPSNIERKKNSCTLKDLLGQFEPTMLSIDLGLVVNEGCLKRRKLRIDDNERFLVKLSSKLICVGVIAP